MSVYYAEKIAGVVYYKADAWPTLLDNDGTNSLQGITELALCDELVVGGGVGGITYSDTEIGSGGNFIVKKNITIRKTTVDDPDYAIHIGRPKLQFTQDVNAFAVSGKTATVRGFTAEFAITTSKYAFFLSNDCGMIFDDIKVLNGANGIRINGTGTALFKNVRLLNFGGIGAYSDNAMAVTVRDSMIAGFGSHGWQNASGAGDVSIYNSVIWGCGEDGVKVSDGSVTLYDSIVGAVGVNNNAYCLDQSGGTLAANNCILLPMFKTPGSLTTGTVTINDSLNTSPKWSTPRRQGFFTVVIDDASSYEFFKSLAYTLSVPVTLALDSADTFTDWEELAGYLSDNDLACHSLNHPKLTRMNDVSISSTRTNANVAININNPHANPTFWNGTITLSDDDNASDYVISVPGDAGRMDELKALIDDYDDANWTMTLDTNNNPSIAKVAPTCLDDDYNAAPGMIPMQQDKYWYYEVVWPKYIIEQAIQAYIPGWECETFVHPHNDSSEDLRAFLANDSKFIDLDISAYKGGRGSNLGDYNTGDGVDVYNIYGPSTYSDIIDTATIEMDASAIGETMAWLGGACVLYGHHSELTEQNWSDIVAAIQGCAGCSFSDLRGLIASIKTKGDMSDRVLTIIWADTISHKIQALSSCVNAGKFRDALDISDIRGPDPDGNYVYRQPNIGVDQGAGTPAGRGASPLVFGGMCNGGLVIG